MVSGSRARLEGHSPTTRTSYMCFVCALFRQLTTITNAHRQLAASTRQPVWMVSALTSPTFAMVCPTARTDRMSTAAAMDVDASRISSCAPTRSVWSAPGVAMVRTIVVTTPTRNPATQSQVVPHAVTTSSSAPVDTAFPRASSVMTSTIVAMAAMRSVAVRTRLANHSTVLPTNFISICNYSETRGHSATTSHAVSAGGSGTQSDLHSNWCACAHNCLASELGSCAWQVCLEELWRQW